MPWPWALGLSALELILGFVLAWGASRWWRYQQALDERDRRIRQDARNGPCADPERARGDVDD